MLSYLIMRVLVEGACLTKGEAEVQVALMGVLFGWEVNYTAKDTAGRNDSSAIRKRIERFKASPRWAASGPWQMFLWDTLRIPPERGLRLSSLVDTQREDELFREMCRRGPLSANAWLASLRAQTDDRNLIWRGFEHDLGLLSEQLDKAYRRVTNYMEDIGEVIRHQLGRSASLKELVGRWTQQVGHDEKDPRFVGWLSKDRAAQIVEAMGHDPGFPMRKFKRLAILCFAAARRHEELVHRLRALKQAFLPGTFPESLPSS